MLSSSKRKRAPQPPATALPGQAPHTRGVQCRSGTPPRSYGYIPHTLSRDGDPVDVLVLSPVPLISGVVVRCRPIGMLKLKDEKGGDEKVLAVPIDKLCSLYRKIKTHQDLPELVLSQIAHFFEHYKDLEPGKWVGPTEARQEILEGVKRYKRAAKKPMF